MAFSSGLRYRYLTGRESSAIRWEKEIAIRLPPWGIHHRIVAGYTGGARTKLTEKTTRMATPHVGLRSSDRQHQRTDAFVQRIHNGAKRPVPRAMEAITAPFSEESLTSFITDAVQTPDLSPGMPNGLT